MLDIKVLHNHDSFPLEVEVQKFRNQLCDAVDKTCDLNDVYSRISPNFNKEAREALPLAEVLSHLGAARRNLPGEHNLCAVCYGKKDSPVAFVPCGHTLCHRCAKKCLKANSRCPNCNNGALYIQKILLPKT